MENWLFYHIKRKTTCFLIYFWKYEDVYSKFIKNIKNNNKEILFAIIMFYKSNQ